MVCNQETILVRNQPALLTFLNFLSFSSRLPLELLLIEKQHYHIVLTANTVIRVNTITVIRYGSAVTAAPLLWVLTCVAHYGMMVLVSLANLLGQTVEILLVPASYMHPGRKKDFPIVQTHIVTWYTVFRFRTLPPNGVL